MSQDENMVVMHGFASGYDGGDPVQPHHGGQEGRGVALLGPSRDDAQPCCGGSCGAGVTLEGQARRASGSSAWDDEPEVRVRLTDGTWVTL